MDAKTADKKSRAHGQYVGAGIGILLADSLTDTLEKTKPQRAQRDSQRTAKMTENEASNIVIGCALRVHSAFGPGLLESAYAACLHYELVKAGLFVEAQKPLPLVYHDVKLECGYRLDLMVERKLVVEIKS